MAHIVRHFKTSQLPGNPKRKTALLINPPVYDTQYWAERSQPSGLLRVTRLLWGILVTGGESCLIVWKRQGKNARLPRGALHQGVLHRKEYPHPAIPTVSYREGSPEEPTASHPL
jgi:hypothetical protein